MILLAALEWFENMGGLFWKKINRLNVIARKLEPASMKDPTSTKTPIYADKTLIAESFSLISVPDQELEIPHYF